jgi:exopolysaccharide biosynthesis predicted pyruvyltransferase EpsI
MFMAESSPKKCRQTKLLELVKREPRLVYVANLGNLGDALIARATYQFLGRHGLKYQIVRSTDDVKDACVLIAGGGNLIEGKYTDLSAFLQRCGASNRIIILPHSIMGNADLFRSVADRAHIFAREVATYRFLTSIGVPHERVFLADDMAFALTDELRNAEPMSKRAILMCLREDVESTLPFGYPKSNFDVSKLMIHHWDDPVVAHHASEILLKIVADHEMIVTDRLHVAIAGAVLGRQVKLLPNSYYKNRGVFELSMQDFHNVAFVNFDAIRDLCDPDASQRQAP